MGASVTGLLSCPGRQVNPPGERRPHHRPEPLTPCPPILNLFGARFPSLLMLLSLGLKARRGGQHGDHLLPYCASKKGVKGI